MADLEELALRRDRGYLVRLLLLMVGGFVFALFVYAWLTGSGVSGCLAGALGSEEKPKQTQHQSTPRR